MCRPEFPNLYALVLVFGWLAGRPCRAELAFTAKEATLTAKPSDSVLEAKFEFRNAGPKPVKVYNLASSCQCLGAKADKESYAPGESGVITARYSASAFSGRHTKSLAVSTDDGAKPVELKVTLVVPEFAKVVPPALNWPLNGPAEPKPVKLTFNLGQPVKVAQITCTKPGFRWSVKETDPGKSCEITVTPEQTDTILMAALRIQTDSPFPKHKNHLVILSISPQAAKK